MNSYNRTLGVYLAASWSQKADMATFRDRIHQADPRITVVSTWMDENHTIHSALGGYDPTYQRQIAVQDAAELDAAQVLVLFSQDPTVPKIGGGKHWEFGYAYHAQKTCLFVGQPEHVFYYMPGVYQVHTEDDALDFLKSCAVGHQNDVTLLYDQKRSFVFGNS